MHKSNTFYHYFNVCEFEQEKQHFKDRDESKDNIRKNKVVWRNLFILKLARFFTHFTGKW